MLQNYLLNPKRAISKYLGITKFQKHSSERAWAEFFHTLTSKPLEPSIRKLKPLELRAKYQEVKSIRVLSQVAEVEQSKRTGEPQKGCLSHGIRDLKIPPNNLQR